MKPARDPALIARVQAALDLYETAEAMMRQRLHRGFPHESPEQIEQRVLAWLQDRPGAEHGDASGPVQAVRIFQ
jgi:hypothetical protein